MYRVRTSDQHFTDGGPKRILALDGGGLRGILTLAFLKRIEDELRARHGGASAFRLCDYFDLIAGTSTGAIIAAALAIGWSVDDITKKYSELGARVFVKSFLRQGLLRAKYDEALLIRELQSVYGASTTLGSDAVRTGLLVMIKRLDSGSPWPVSNNPRGKYFSSKDGSTIGNGDYLLWQAVRASTAAPDFFAPERITIAQLPGHPPLVGDFVDGGVSPFNNPALQAFLYATLDGYRVRWPAGANNIFLVSLGTGMADSSVRHTDVAVAHAVRALISLMDDCAALQETLLQLMSDSPTARAIDSEIGSLDGDSLGSAHQLSYVRYNADLRAVAVRELLGQEAGDALTSNLGAMDVPDNMHLLHRIGALTAARQVSGGHFPEIFDLPEERTDSHRRRYVRRPDRPVTAIRLSLETAGLNYRKWGAEQHAKAGDWLVQGDGDVYTVDAAAFARTYQQTGPGSFIKTTPVWAERALTSGSVATKEGATRYEAGDYIVSNDEAGSDKYAMSAATFDMLYQPVDPE